MNAFKIVKSELKKNFTGIYTPDLGQAAGCLKLCGLKLYLYLAGHRNGDVWILNPALYAEWLGMNYDKQGRTVRKAIQDGISDLLEHGYLVVEDSENFLFLEQNVPKNC